MRLELRWEDVRAGSWARALDDDQHITEYSLNLSLKEIPEGKQTIAITVSEPEAKPEPFPAAPVAAASVASVAVLG
jgi:hypothetical protein